MSDYTPTTEQILEAWISRYDGQHSWASREEVEEYKAEFVRWLGKHEDKIVEAYEERIIARLSAKAREDDAAAYPFIGSYMWRAVLLIKGEDV